MNKTKTNITAKPGYKKTKLGWIPEEWKVVKLSDSAMKERWSFTGGPFGSNLKVSDYTNEGVRILQLQNIGDGVFINSNEGLIRTSKEKADELISSNIYPGDIIISKMGDPVARACFIPDDEERYVMASDGIRLKVDESEWSSRYVLDQINSFKVRKNAIRKSIGSTRQRIGLNDLRGLPFLKPPLPEQKKIAEILSTWDEAIQKMESLIQKKEQLKRGLMQQLLTGKKRFDGFEGEWRKKKLGKLVKTFSGGTPSRSRPEYYGGNLPWIKSGELNNSRIYKTEEKITEEGLKNSSAKVVDKNTLILAIYGATAGVISVNKIKKAAINQAVLALIPKVNELDQIFLEFWFSYYKDKIVHTFTQGGQPNLSAKIIKALILHYPKLDEQKIISNVMIRITGEINSLKKTKIALELQKKGLMQQLLTGKTRV